MFNFTQTLTALLLAGACTTSIAAEYWVSKEKGSDNTVCSEASPCTSIQAGLNLLKAGDTLTIGKGTYIEDSTSSKYTAKCGLLDANYGSLCVKSSGELDKPITIRRDPNTQPGDVVIDSQTKRAGLIISKHDYIHVRGLAFINNWTGGIATPGGPAAVPTEQTPIPSPSVDILSIGCVIEENIILNTQGAYGVNVSAIYMWSTKDWIVKNNLIQNVYVEGTTGGNGIQTYGTINALIEFNTITGVDHGIQWKDHYVLNGKYKESVIRKNKLLVNQTGVRISIRGDGANAAGDNLIDSNIIELFGESATGVTAFLAGANAVSSELIIKNNLILGRNIKHTGINADSLETLELKSNIFTNLDIEISLRLKGDTRPAKLKVVECNAFESKVQILHDRYSSDPETFNSLESWKLAAPSKDSTLTSLRRDNPGGELRDAETKKILDEASKLATTTRTATATIRQDIDAAAELNQIAQTVPQILEYKTILPTPFTFKENGIDCRPGPWGDDPSQVGSPIKSFAKSPVDAKAKQL